MATKNELLVREKNPPRNLLLKNLASVAYYHSGYDADKV